MSVFSPSIDMESWLINVGLLVEFQRSHLGSGTDAFFQSRSCPKIITQLVTVET